jgi:hypothetical protein
MPSGPWDNEPDFMEFVHKDTGYTIVIRRNGVGALCGYVGIDEDHLLHRRRYQDCLHEDAYLPTEEQIIEGTKWLNGFTDDGFSFPEAPHSMKEVVVKQYSETLHCPEGYDKGHCDHRLDSQFEVHGGITFTDFMVKSPVSDLSKWYIGFDCAHLGDKSPTLEKYASRENDVYRDISYVLDEATNLANQIKKYEKLSDKEV